MLEGLIPKEILEQIWTWAQSNILTLDSLYQGIVMLLSFVFGYILARFFKKHIAKLIDEVPWSIRVKRILKNLARLIWPSITLVFMFIGSLIETSTLMDIDVGLTKGVMKVLAAWIGIRIAVQFIRNSLIRNSIGAIIWVMVALSIFGVLDETMAALDAVGFNIGNFRLSALAVIKSAISIFVLLYMAQFVSSVAERRILKTKSLTRSSQVLISKIIRILLIIVALFIGVTSAGIDLSLSLIHISEPTRPY